MNSNVYTQGCCSRMRCKRPLLPGLVLSYLVMVSSCSPSLYLPTPADVSSESSLEELVEGRRLYANHCSGCHTLHLPTQFSEEMWRETLDKMQSRSKTTYSEKMMILKYLAIGRQRMMR